MSRPSRREVLLVVALLAGLVVLFFPDVVLGGRTVSSTASQWGVMGERPPYGYPETGDAPHPRLLRGGPDYNNYLADPLASSSGLEPLAEKISRLLRQGDVPVWAGSIGLGRPVLGAWGLTPLRAPVYFAPTPVMWDIYLLARLVVAGLFTYLLARRLGLRHGGGVLGATAFAFTGYAMLFINMPHVDYAMMLPVALVAVDRVIEAATPSRVTVGAIAVALSMLTNNPRTTVVVIGVMAAFGAYRAWALHGRDGLRRLGPLALTLGAAIGLTMWAVLPFLELIGGPGFPGQAAMELGGDVGLNHLPIPSLISEIVPFFEGAPALAMDGDPTEVNHYVGMTPVFLAAIAVVAERRRMRPAGWFLLVGAVLVWAKLYGLPGVNELGGLPILRDVRWNKYLPPLGALFVALLAGMGLDAIRRWPGRAVWLVAGSLVTILALLVAANAAVLPVLPRSHLAVQLGAVLAALAATVGMWVLFRRGLLSHAAAAGGLVALVVLELLFQTFPVKEDWLPPGVQPVLRRTTLQVIDRPARHDPFAEPPFVAFLRTDPAPHRVFGLDRILSPNSAFAFEIEDIRSSLLPLSRLGIYARAFLNPTVEKGFVGAGHPLLGSEIGSPRISGNPMFDLLNVKYVLSADRASPLLSATQFRLVHRAAGVRVYENRDVLPRAFLVHDAEAARSPEDATRRMRRPGFDPTETAVVEGLTAAEERRLPAGRTVAPGTVRVLRADDARTELAVETGAPALLVLSEMWYPGWKATVDGRPAAVRPADVALRSILVGPGRHRVVVAYRSGVVATGAMISGAVLLALLAATGWSAIRRRSARSKGRARAGGR